MRIQPAALVPDHGTLPKKCHDQQSDFTDFFNLLRTCVLCYESKFLLPLSWQPLWEKVRVEHTHLQILIKTNECKKRVTNEINFT